MQALATAVESKQQRTTAYCPTNQLELNQQHLCGPQALVKGHCLAIAQHQGCRLHLLHPARRFIHSDATLLRKAAKAIVRTTLRTIKECVLPTLHSELTNQTLPTDFKQRQEGAAGVRSQPLQDGPS